MRPLRPALALASVALAVLASGCAAGGSSSSKSSTTFTGDKAAVAQVVSDLEAATKKRDGDKVCKDFLAPALLKTFTTGKPSCKSTMNDNLADADAFGMDVTAVTVTGATATAVVLSDAGKDNAKQKNTFTFVKDPGANGAWKISSFG
jgi:hypothetical protein